MNVREVDTTVVGRRFTLIMKWTVTSTTAPRIWNARCMNQRETGMKNRNLSITPPSVKKGATAKTAAVGGTRRSLKPSAAAGIMTSMVGMARSRKSRWRKNGVNTIVKKNFVAGSNTVITEKDAATRAVVAAVGVKVRSLNHGRGMILWIAVMANINATTEAMSIMRTSMLPAKVRRKRSAADPRESAAILAAHHAAGVEAAAVVTAEATKNQRKRRRKSVDPILVADQAPGGRIRDVVGGGALVGLLAQSNIRTLEGKTRMRKSTWKNGLNPPPWRTA